MTKKEEREIKAAVKSIYWSKAIAKMNREHDKFVQQLKDDQKDLWKKMQEPYTI